MKKLGLLAAAGAMALASVTTMPTPVKAQADPFLGQMMLFGGNFCPRGWATAEGQLLAISQYSALFSLLGTTYGGDGRTTFGLPDLRGRAPIGVGTGAGLPTYAWGQRGGTVDFTLNTNTMPSHTHTGTMSASRATGNSRNPAGKVPAVDSGSDLIYQSGATDTDMAANILRINPTGANQAVSKRSPYLAMYWCVALQGVFPSRN